MKSSPLKAVATAVLLAGIAFILFPGSPVRAGLPDNIAVTKVRFFPRAGFAGRMKGGKFTGSNEGATTDFKDIAVIKETPPEGAWSEIIVAKPVAYRYIKYEAPLASYGNVAEIEFYAGDTKLVGTPFGTTGSRDDKGNDFSKALDGNTETFFDGKEQHNQYVGYDLGPESQAAKPELAPAGGSYPKAVEVKMTTTTPGATVKYALGGRSASGDGGLDFKEPVKIEANKILVAVAVKPGRASSPETVATYRIGGPAGDANVVRTYHIGNSLTDTINGWLEPLAASAGKKLEFHRFTIPGAPTEWLLAHSGSGFGDPRYREAFVVLAPIHHIFTQPFAGHGRSVENEADCSGQFFDLCHESSPDVQMWLYCQWPGPEFKDRWAQWKGDDLKGVERKPAATWQEGALNHLAYTELVRDKLMKTWKGRPVLIVPGGPALARLKDEIEAGKVPGMTDFVKTVFADGIHMTDAGRYLISLVHYACIYKEDPTGKVSLLKSGLTEEQGKIFQRIAWETASGYPGSGIKIK